MAEIRIGPMGSVEVSHASTGASAPIVLAIVEDDFAPRRAVIVLDNSQAVAIAAELLDRAGVRWRRERLSDGMRRIQGEGA